MDISRRALTTIPCRSLGGAQLAQFASTLLVCAGVVLLLPTPASSDHDALSESGASVCVDSPNPSPDHQWTDGVAINAPDSCDDEDEDDDDGDDESPGGAGHGIAPSHQIPAHHDAASRVVRV